MRAGPVVMTVLQPGPDRAASLAAFEEWMGAHRFLPSNPEGPWPGLDAAGVSRWHLVLSDAGAPRDLVLEGLALLAHTPRRDALEVLTAYAAAPHAGLASVARMALEQCMDWQEG
jgi:hypothetical protein